MRNSQTGAVQKLTLFVITLLIAAGIFGFVAYRMSNKDDIDPTIKDALANAECANIDENLCKFFASWGVTNQYKLTAAEDVNGKVTEYTLDDQTHQNFRLTAQANDKSRETILVDKHVYIRSGDSNWRHQVVDNPDSRQSYREINRLDFEVPADEAAASAYSAAGEENCDERTCFRYQVATDDSDKTTYIWFDNKEYRLRRVQITGDNYSYNATLSYSESVQVEEPTQFVSVDNGLVILPGKTEPQADSQGVAGTNTSTPSNTDNELPSTGDSFDPEEYRKWLEMREQRAN